MMTGTQNTTGRETTAMAETSDVTLPQSRRSWTGRAEPRPAGGRRASCSPRAEAAAVTTATASRTTRTPAGSVAPGPVRAKLSGVPSSPRLLNPAERSPRCQCSGHQVFAEQARIVCTRA
jgi:hypothetical protein